MLNSQQIEEILYLKTQMADPRDNRHYIHFISGVCTVFLRGSDGICRMTASHLLICISQITIPSIADLVFRNLYIKLPFWIEVCWLLVTIFKYTLNFMWQIYSISDLEIHIICICLGYLLQYNRMRLSFRESGLYV